jgi:phosphinothricin acetyltransferase
VHQLPGTDFQHAATRTFESFVEQGLIMIEIRAATPDDAAAIAGIYAPFVATNAVSFETEAPSPREMKARIKAGGAQLPWLVAVDEESRVVLGYALAKPFKPGNAYRFAVETAVYGAGELAGKGIKRQLLGTLIATLTAQNYTQAIVTLTTPNDQLIQLYESAGFRRAGAYREISYKSGQWLDVGLWQRELAEAGSPPDEPKAFSTVGVVRA